MPITSRISSDDDDIRERLARLEATAVAHNDADEQRHRELLDRMTDLSRRFERMQSDTRRLLLAQLGLIALVVCILGAIVGVRVAFDGPYDVEIAAP